MPSSWNCAKLTNQEMNYFVGNISVLITLVLSTTNHKTGKYIQPQPVPQKCQARFLGHVSPEREFFVRVLIETRERRSLGLSSIWAKTRTRGRNSTRSFVECGGAIVDKQWILTSAGCLKGISERYQFTFDTCIVGIFSKTCPRAFCAKN